MLVSTVSLDRKQTLNAAASITQAFVSVRKHPAEPKTEPLCVDKAC